MIKSNRIDFTNVKINMLSFTRKLYTNKESFRVSGKQYRLKLRVSPSAKTFCFWNGDRRITLGEFGKQFGASEATYEAIKMVNGEAPITTPKMRVDSFKECAEKVFAKKIKQGKMNVGQERRAFKALPDSIANKPIHKITREDVIAWKEMILEAKKSWNHAVAVPNNVWNVCADNWHYSVLENKRNPFSKTKELVDRTEYPVPSFKELKEIWKVANSYGESRISMAIKLKILTGMHQTEMLDLKLEDVRNCGEWLEVNHKIGRKHKIYLTPQTRALLDSFIKLSKVSLPNSPLLSFDGVKPLSKDAIARNWKKALSSTGLDFRFDRLRHALITEMEDTGFESKYITGHCYKENLQARCYKNWDSEKMQEVFKKANTYWQDEIYGAVINTGF